MGAPKDQGAVLLAVLILVVIVTIVGVSMLSVSNVSQRQAGSYRGRQSLEIAAESALEIAELRLKNIALNNDSGITQNFFFKEICMPSSCTVTPEPSCPNGYPGNDNKDILTADTNVICNFLGTDFKNGRAILIRKEDMTDASDPANPFMQLLLNLASYDSAGRRKILQAGFVLQYNKTTFVPTDPTTPLILVARQWLNN